MTARRNCQAEEMQRRAIERIELLAFYRQSILNAGLQFGKETIIPSSSGTLHHEDTLNTFVKRGYANLTCITS
jgi:hypothetical protein